MTKTFSLEGTTPLPSGLSLSPFAAADDARLLALHERVFGPGRFARTAFRLRETANVLQALSFTASLDGTLVGAVTMSRIQVGAAKGVLLGPLAVEKTIRDVGVGKALLTTSVKAAFSAGEPFVLLVGDLPYYKFAGFEMVPFGRLQMPGPVDPARLLVASNSNCFDAEAFAGLVRGA